MFAPCERVIVEQATNSISLIGLLQDLTAPIAEGTEVPENAMVQQPWYIFTAWWKDDSESEEKFEQAVRLENPKGAVALEILTTFEMSKTHHRVIGAVHAFPIGIEGTYLLRLNIKAAGTTDWTEVATYPLTVKTPRST